MGLQSRLALLHPGLRTVGPGGISFSSLDAAFVCLPDRCGMHTERGDLVLTQRLVLLPRLSAASFHAATPPFTSRKNHLHQGLPCCPVVTAQWFHCWAPVQSLVRELRSCKLCGMVKKKNPKQNNSNKTQPAPAIAKMQLLVRIADFSGDIAQ